MQKTKGWIYATSMASIMGIYGAGCGTQQDSGDIALAEGAALGDALPGTNSATFAAAKANFELTETVQDGAGPIFNERSCSACHSNGTTGGAGQNIERRYGRTNGTTFDAMDSTGGSLRQLFGIGGFNPSPGLNCQSGTDANPAPGATIFAGRLTTPLFGLGLVDSLPDGRFDTLAGREPANIRGIVNRVRIAVANPADSGQSVGGTRVGRFGWKAGVSNLGQFSADAYLNEMGITTTSCNRGVVNSSFATENRANRAGTNAVINGCPDDQIPGTDEDFADENNNCAGGLDELQTDVGNFTFFMAHLAAPPQQAIATGSAQDRGRTLFNSASLACSGCHRDDADIFVSTSTGGVAANVRFHPMSDFLLHDMGALGDRIGNTGDAVSTTTRMRTAPLWGLRSRNLLLHDGRTSDRAAAIRAHAGQGAGASSAFSALSSAQQNDLLSYLTTL